MKRQVSTSAATEDVESDRSSKKSIENGIVGEGSHKINIEDKQKQSETHSSGEFEQSFKMALRDRKYLKASSYVKPSGNKKRIARKVKQRLSRFGSKC